MPLDYPTPDLSDGLIRLRRWGPADTACVQSASREPPIHVGTTVPHTDDEPAALAYIDRQLSRAELDEGWSLAIADQTTGVAVGQAYLGVRPQADVFGLGYWLLPTARGQGNGRRAVTLLAHWAFTELAAARVEAWVEPQNVPSQRLLESRGFVREGLLRAFLDLDGRRADVFVYSRIAADGLPGL